ncbi:hypothetical protein EST38_g4002 [Candolleomyces aberdarensis]|uniref:Nephrocystin 3-like N-terminal domain-containing protein n=1 Tax=Candolleomyces aberdarensis TaxID=2316362 RepID=A0A4Q2DP06_9AGAR|nr:hypothetical protein EST38_g4002 [Candolleomyces aberdarensis]
MALPETAELIEAAAMAEPDLLTTNSSLSLSARLQYLVYEPFKAVVGRKSRAKSFFTKPYLIVIDGLDECEDKEGVQEFITSALKFFIQHPSIPLRFFITSRVEQHIHSSCLKDGGVCLKDLASFCSRNDIQAFMRTVFDAQMKANPIIQAYVRHNGPWPSPSDANKLVDHIGGSFIFASTLFRFIFEQNSKEDNSTPMDRLPLALNINPGLDALYSQTLARAEHLPHFTNILSNIALLARPLPISGIAELLDIEAHQVSQVLVDLQAIIQVPGTDDAPVTFFHTSLRDFLTTESRSGRFFADPSFHVRLFIQCITCELKMRRRSPEMVIQPKKQSAAVRYALEDGQWHWDSAIPHFNAADLEVIVEMQRELVELHPYRSRALNSLGITLRALSARVNSVAYVEQAVAVHREELGLRLPPHPQRYESLNSLGIALQSLFEHTGSFHYAEEAVTRHREALSRLSSSHPDRPNLLNNLGTALHSLYRCGQSVPYVEEAITRHRDALGLQQSPHLVIARARTLNMLGTALLSLFEHTMLIPHAEEAISLYHQALDLQPLQHPDRPQSLDNLGVALCALFGQTKSVSTIEEAISAHREALSLRPPPHPCRDVSLIRLGKLLLSRFERKGSEADLDEVIPLLRESITQYPGKSIDRTTNLADFSNALLTRFAIGQSLRDLEEAILYTRELVVEHYQDGHSFRSSTLRTLASLLQRHFDVTMDDCHLNELATLQKELGD